MKRKCINLIGDIDHEMYKHLKDELVNIKYHEPVNITLCSDGGDAMIALAIFDTLYFRVGWTTVTATGLVASAAVLILAAGHERKMTKNSWVMVHEDEVVLEEGTRVKKAEKDVAHARRLEVQWNDILCKATGSHPDVWAKLHENETYLNAEECKKLNLITEII